MARPRSLLARFLLGLGAFLAVVALLTVGAGSAWSRPRPDTGVTGAAADALAESLRAAVHLDGWARTGAVRWTMAGHTEYLWDRERGLSRVRWGRVEVLQRTDQRVGRTWRGGREIHGDARAKLVAKAWARFTNDSFWLQPLESLYDAGVTRSVVASDGAEGLLVEYASGGVTPGDAFLWLPGPDGRPEAWRMWASILPIGGLRATWEDWQTLSTGAEIATRHALGPFRFGLTGVAGTATLQELEPGPDPFAPLVDWAE